MKRENQQPFRIHQYHYSVSRADGISHQMFFIQSALSKIGISGSIFASQLNQIKSPHAFQLNLEQIWNCDLLLIHHSHGNPDLRKLAPIEIPKALVYHNIVSEKFYPHDPFMAELSHLGRRQLNSLRKETIASFTGSQFNLLDLKHHHYPNPQLLPLIDFSKDLAELKTPSIRLLKTEPKNLLFVGRLTPHKNQALLIKTFFYLKKSLPKGSKLFLVGTQDPTYTEYLKLLTKQLGLSQEVKITGPVTRKSLENYYEISDALVCLSEQEGFCIPLVEAMSRHLPIFFHLNTGVQETMGKSGCALNTQNPWEIAEIISTVLNSNQAMNSLVKSQHRRWVELSREQNSKKVQDLLLDLVIKLRTTPSLQMNRRGASHFLTQG